MVLFFVVIPLLVLGSLVTLGFVARRECPSCALRLPVIRSPQTVRQATWGGWTCPRCGTLADRRGRPVDHAR